MKLTTTLHENEGRANLPETIRLVARFAQDFDVRKVIVFAAHGEGVLQLREMLERERTIVAVTFPAGLTASPEGKQIFIGMPSAEDRRLLGEAGVAIIQGIMPFRAIGEVDSISLRTLKRALDLFGGSLELCVQAVLMACDAGQLYEGERCIVMTSDTGLVVRAGNAFRFMRDQSAFSVEHIICKPLHYQITRKSAYPPPPPSMESVASGVAAPTPLGAGSDAASPGSPDPETSG